LWNRSQKIRDPKTGNKHGRPRPEEEWVIVELPHLRIVSEQQWQRSQAQIKIKRERFGTRRLGGLGRTLRCKEYLFSGLLMCGICGYRMCIVGGGKYARYGCTVHRYKGACSNRLNIRHSRLEDQLLHGVLDVALRPDMLEYAISEFHKRLQLDSAKYLEDRALALSQKPKLKAEFRKLEIEARHLAKAIAQYGSHRSPTLLAQLSHTEERIATIERNLKEPIHDLPNVPIERIRAFVFQQASNLKSVLLSDRDAAKLAIRTHFKPLILSPKETENGPVLKVEGSFDLFSGLEDVMLLVAPQGFFDIENK
jgi:site-specific DNA recombinase